MTPCSGLHVTVWCPAFKKKDGGVQQFSRLLVQALQNSSLVRRCKTIALHPGKTHRFSFILRACAGLLFYRPDLLIITHLHLARLSPLLEILHIPYWVCAHGIECWKPLQKTDQRSMSKARRVLCVSRFTQDQLLQHNPQLSLATSILPNHLPPTPEPFPSRIEARQRLLPTVTEDVFVLLTVSRLAAMERYKGHRQMFRALKVLIERGENVLYLIVGEGDDRLPLESLSQSLGIASHVLFLGRIDEEMLELAYAACDAFAMPSTGEGFGIVYLEALARGRPVLAGNHDGSVDALKDGALGILVDPLNEESLIQGLQKLRDVASTTDPSELQAAVSKEFGSNKLQERLDLLLQNHLSLCAE